MSEFDRKKELRRFFVWLLLGLSVIVGMEISHVQVSSLFDKNGIRNAGDLLTGFLQPNFSADFLQRLLQLSIESLAVGMLGTVFAVVLGTVLALVAIRVPELTDPPGKKITPGTAIGGLIRWLARFILGFFRSIPEIVWAYLFVQILGLGPGAAVFAIALTVGGSIGKLYSELGEAVDGRIVGGLRATGAGRLAILLYGILPQVRRQWVAYALFRMECNIRTGTILGVVGAGGLGSEISLAIRYFEFDKLATALLAVLLFVVILELVSAYLRRNPVKWSMVFAVLGGIASIVYLDIPWRDLITGNVAGLPAASSLDFSSAYLSKTVGLVTDTVLMAWISTLLAAVIAFFLAPLSTDTLVTRSYLEHTYPKRGIARVFAWLTLWASRFSLQVGRAMPELTLALVFVVWVGPGMFAGILAIAAHNVGVLGRLYTDVYEEVEPGPARALQASGTGPLGTWLFGVLPQVFTRVVAFTLYRFEVNIRATATVGFVGAGGIGDALYTSISLFHVGDLIVLLMVMVALVTIVDLLGDRVRKRILLGSKRENAKKHQKGRVAAEAQEEIESLAFAGVPITNAATVWVRPSVKQSYRQAVLTSFSSTGMTLTCADQCPCGLVVQAVITDPDTQKRLTATARVANPRTCNGPDSTAHLIELEFVQHDQDFLPALQKLAQLFAIPSTEREYSKSDNSLGKAGESMAQHLRPSPI